MQRVGVWTVPVHWRSRTSRVRGLQSESCVLGNRHCRRLETRRQNRNSNAFWWMEPDPPRHRVTMAPARQWHWALCRTTHASPGLSHRQEMSARHSAIARVIRRAACDRSDRRDPGSSYDRLKIVRSIMRESSRRAGRAVLESSSVRRPAHRTPRPDSNRRILSLVSPLRDQAARRAPRRCPACAERRNRYDSWQWSMSDGHGY